MGVGFHVRVKGVGFRIRFNLFASGGFEAGYETLFK